MIVAQAMADHFAVSLRAIKSQTQGETSHMGELGVLRLNDKVI